MLKRYLPLAAMTALLTAAATVAQPQTTTGADASSTATPSTSSDAATTGTNSSTSGTTSSDTSGTSDSTSSATGGTSGTNSATTGSSSDATTNQAGTMGTASTAATTGSLQGQDATFLRKAAEGDRMEIASAQAALDSAQRTDTKNAARMILEDHQASSQKLQALASRKGWTLPDASDAAESDQAMNTASGSGSFDDRFMADQIRMHREAISLYRAQASSGSDPDLRQFARDQLPHLEHHLEMLQGSNTQK
jgi:putative membrane protein